MPLILLAVLLCLGAVRLHAQSSYVPLNEDYYHLVDRYEVKAGRVVPGIFTVIKPYKRSAIVAFLDSLETRDPGVFVSAADRFNKEYLRNDNWEWSGALNESKRPVLKYFYRKRSDFFYVQEEDFDLHINPVLYLGVGRDADREDRLFINTRGVEVRGVIDGKLGFYTYLADNQALLPFYVWRQMADNPVIPHEGFWKDFKDGKGVDFLHARGYITFEATRHINLRFGHDRFFVGNGYRSLVLSDYGPPSLFFGGNVRIWKINYLFLVNRLTADVSGSLTGLKGMSNGYPHKYAALHHLSLNIGRKLNIGVFESVIFSPEDTTGADPFRIDYLNPIIFYRAIEQQNGSSDNVLLGFDIKWNAFRKLSFYGQFLLDEFVIDNIRNGNGWWANKFGIQAGGKYVDAFGIANLDLQGEINLVRPYTYSHGTRYGSYSTYRQPIAHPVGANFKEFAVIMRYQPVPRLNLTGKLVLIRTGRDTTGVNWGGDILKVNSSREKDFNNTIGQGIDNTITYATFVASWQWKHNLFIDASLVFRKSESPVARFNDNTWISSLALRWNIPQRLYEF